MTFYDDMKDLASDVLDEFDQGGVKLVKVTEGGGTPDEPGSPTLTEHTLDAVVRGVSFKYLKEGFATSTDLQVAAAVLDGINVNADDYIKINGVNYNIIQDISLPATGTKSVWKFIVRKGG